MGTADRGRLRIWRPWLPILGLQLLLTIPFVGQPVHLDDHIYVDIGRNVLLNPWHPQDFPYFFEGRYYPDMGSHSHPPFVAYWIGLLLWVFGDGPRLHLTLHLGFLIFPVLFAAGMYRLAVRFSGSPRLAAMVAITSPAAIVMSHSLMADYPTLAFWTLGVALYIEGVDRRKPARVWTAGILLALAAFSSYPALGAAGLCWIYAWLKKSDLGAARWAPLLAVGWIGLWLTYSSLYFDRFVLAQTTEYFIENQETLGAARMTEKLLSLPILLAGALAVPWPLLRQACGWLKGSATALWAVASILLAQAYAADYALVERLLVILFLMAGGWVLLGLLVTLSRVLRNGLRDLRQDVVFLSVWAGFVVAVVLLVYSYGAARYLLPLLPPLVLLAFYQSPAAAGPGERQTAVAAIAVAIALSLSLSVADFEIARVHRDIARDLGAELKGWESETRFSGEWGFRHYMLEQGFRQFASTSADLEGGQMVITPRQAVPHAGPPDIESILLPVGQRDWPSSFPIRLMHQESHAGFYSSGWGLLPFSFSLAPVEEITIRQVSYLVEKLPEITLENAAEGETIIPRPAPEGGIDLWVPVPGTLRIPYDGPPARIQFSCLWPDGSARGECPVRVYLESNGDRLELTPDGRNSSPDAPDRGLRFFVLEAAGQGHIVLNVTGSEVQDRGQEALIRNWRILPLEGTL